MKNLMIAILLVFGLIVNSAKADLQIKVLSIPGNYLGGTVATAIFCGPNVEVCYKIYTIVNALTDPNPGEVHKLSVYIPSTEEGLCDLPHTNYANTSYNPISGNVTISFNTTEATVATSSWSAFYTWQQNNLGE